MKDTCNIKKCPVAKKLKVRKEEECPNYVEGLWTPEGESKPTLIKDCVNQRTLLMIQDLYGRLIGVQKSQEEMRNKYEQSFLSLKLLSENIKLNFQNLLSKKMGVILNMEREKKEKVGELVG